MQERLELFEERLKKLSPPPQVERPKSTGPRRKEDYQAKVWVTRPHPFVDRMASAWLIRRFIDPQARFEFLEKDQTDDRVSRCRVLRPAGGCFLS